MARPPSAISHRPLTTICVTKALSQSLRICAALSGETIGEYCERVFAPVVTKAAREGIASKPAAQ